MKVMMTLSYDGSKFRGFQLQRDGTKTVANKLERVFKRLKIDSAFNASGRTDSFVHALNQVIDINLPPYWSDLDKLKTTLNRHLHPEIHIKQIKVVDHDFHARFSAKKREYRYIIKEGEYSVFEAPYVLFYDKRLDIELLKEAIKVFEGEHDFRNFMKSGSDVLSSVRRVYKTLAYIYNDSLILSFIANGYLRSQIRMMVAYLLMINEGKKSIDDLKDELSLKHSSNIKPIEPNGLYLARIWY